MRTIASLVLSVLAFSRPLMGAPQSSITPAAASLTAAAPFSRIAGIAELRDGRLVVVDAGEQRVMLVDLAAGTSTQIGRTGSGPNEYVRPFGPLRLPGDSCALYDAGNHRLLRIDPAGRPAGTVPLPEALYAGRSVSVPRGADAAGYLYFETLDTRQRDRLPVTGAIVRWHPATTYIDSVTSLAVRDQGQRKVLAPFVTRDGWAVGDSGLALVRAVPYHAEWHRPGRPPVVGGRVRATPFPLNEGEIDAYWNGLQARGAARARMEGGTAGGRSAEGDRSRWDYPDRLPLFDAGRGIFIDRSQSLWVVRRGRWNDTMQSVDVFDRAESMPEP